MDNKRTSLLETWNRVEIWLTMKELSRDHSVPVDKYSKRKELSPTFGQESLRRGWWEACMSVSMSVKEWRTVDRGSSCSRSRSCSFFGMEYDVEIALQLLFTFTSFSSYFYPSCCKQSDHPYWSLRRKRMLSFRRRRRRKYRKVVALT